MGVTFCVLCCRELYEYKVRVSADVGPQSKQTAPKHFDLCILHSLRRSRFHSQQFSFPSFFPSSYGPTGFSSLPSPLHILIPFYSLNPHDFSWQFFLFLFPIPCSFSSSLLSFLLSLFHTSSPFSYSPPPLFSSTHSEFPLCSILIFSLELFWYLLILV